MGMGGVFQIGKSGMQAARAGVSTAGHNIANANTVGFKTSRPEFQDIVAKSLKGAMGGNQIGCWLKRGHGLLAMRTAIEFAGFAAFADALFSQMFLKRTPMATAVIERAKRLVELGHDVVVLLDSLTRLGRAYNLAAPANGRVLAGIVDASAVQDRKSTRLNSSHRT